METVARFELAALCASTARPGCKPDALDHSCHTVLKPPGTLQPGPVHLTYSFTDGPLRAARFHLDHCIPSQPVAQAFAQRFG